LYNQYFVPSNLFCGILLLWTCGYSKFNYFKADVSLFNN
jgi:hypothetical protein